MAKLRFLSATIIVGLMLSGPAAIAEQPPAPFNSHVDGDGRIWIYHTDLGCSVSTNDDGTILQLTVGQKNHAITLSTRKQIGVEQDAAYQVALIAGTQTWQKQASGAVLITGETRFEGYHMFADLSFMKALPRSGVIKYGVFDFASKALITQSIDTSHEFYQRWLRCADAAG